MELIVFTRCVITLTYCIKSNISAKLAEHLQSHYAIWQRNANIRTTLLSTEEERSLIQDQIQQHSSTHRKEVLQYDQASIPIPSRAPLRSLPAPASLQSSSLLPTNTTAGQNTLDQFFSLNARSLLQIPSQSEPSSDRQRRRCRRCGKTTDDCAGARSVEFCRKPCQDCGQLDCPGRDPKNYKNSKTCDRSGGRVVRR